LQKNLFAKKDFLKKIGSNRILRERKVFVVAEMPWKILADQSAERQSREALSLSCPEWLRILNEIRTFFRENPDVDF
jgi:hypothetical protein